MTEALLSLASISRARAGLCGAVDVTSVTDQDTDGAVALQLQFHARAMRSIFSKTAAIQVCLAAWP